MIQAIFQAILNNKKSMEIIHTFFTNILAAVRLLFPLFQYTNIGVSFSLRIFTESSSRLSTGIRIDPFI